jgi:S1-C subfamily serine protease
MRRERIFPAAICYMRSRFLKLLFQSIRCWAEVRGKLPLEFTTMSDYYQPRTQGTSSSQRWLVLALFTLAGVLLWQNAVAPAWLGWRASAPATIVPRGDLGADEQSTIKLFNAASPSVVHITTHSLERGLFSMNVTEIPQGDGTGFVWSNQGHIVTNFHVIEEADTVHVALADQSTWKATLVGIAPAEDLAVLKIDAIGSKLLPLPVGKSSDLQVGQKVFAIGNPFGLDQTLTMGLISAVGREIKSRTSRPIKNVIQTDAAINPGNSGGPLLDSSGRLIGVNTAILSPSGSYAGIGFAIPVDTVNWIVPELIAHGRIIRPGLAITVAPESISRRLGVDGALVLTVEPGSEAEKAGLKPTERDRFGNVYLGDIILSVDQLKIASPNDLLTAFEQHKIGEQVTLTITRGRQKKKVTAKLEAR